MYWNGAKPLKYWPQEHLKHLFYNSLAMEILIYGSDILLSCTVSFSEDISVLHESILSVSFIIQIDDLSYFDIHHNWKPTKIQFQWTTITAFFLKFKLWIKLQIFLNACYRVWSKRKHYNDYCLYQIVPTNQRRIQK